MSDKLLLPTGKPHVSFSEVSNWSACSYRHKLRYVEGVDLFKPSVYLDFGTAIHAACENFLKTRVMNPKIATEIIENNLSTQYEQILNTGGSNQVENIRNMLHSELLKI